ncbi:GAF and ANTAR domain-containing protein [Nocardioides dongxiaopingii]|uniref:GAF and ANTAR domain-containing protein n=1 Tax=Nocardioides TaxID=1839 RepID=UPI0010C7710D|nr:MULTISPECIES: GAF and ANTAR domain-containing protein [Nocardioides]QCW49287.1 GAF and ANTAR domain-containing protein [Nocardioides sp. S-1144]
MTDRANGGDTRRERDLIRAFVDLSHELVDDYDIVDMLTKLTANCAELLNVASAGLLLADSSGVLHLAASSSERAHDLELFQLQRDEGPCLDCFRGGKPIVVPELAAAEDQWPSFTHAARSAGFQSVHAVPMRIRTRVLGALGLFGDGVGRLDDEDLELAQALVHVASVAIINEKSAADLETVNTQLQRALDSRVVLEQAKGIVANAGEVNVRDAFVLLRHYARDHGRKLTDVAAEVVSRDLRSTTVLEHARARLS